MNSPLRIGIIGMSGFAADHHDRVKTLERTGEARLIATCDPRAAELCDDDAPFQLRQRGVRIFSDYREMIDACGQQMDLLVVPTPIQLHAEMHRAGVEAGISVYLEKPPTLDYRELENMIACDLKARHASVVGFNFIVEQPRQALKQRLLNGEFGRLREAHLLAEWPRPTGYFTRNAWAGRLLSPEGRIILDSCFGNAMSHYVHNILFWSGHEGMFSWGRPESVQAKLYRAHDIEGADTFFVAAPTDNDVMLRFALTHACCGQSRQIETIVCEKATVRYIVDHQIEINRSDGSEEIITLVEFDALRANHLAYYRYLRGEMTRPMTTLADSRPFVALNDLTYISSGAITDFPSAMINAASRNNQDYLTVTGLSDALRAFSDRGQWPASFGGERVTPPRSIDRSELSRFHDTIAHLSASPRVQAQSACAV